MNSILQTLYFTNKLRKVCAMPSLGGVFDTRTAGIPHAPLSRRRDHFLLKWSIL
jgi:hypothetical protein